MERWQFIQSPGGTWYWLCSDVISRKTRTSAATFKTRNECVANAMGNGYKSVTAFGTQGNTAPPRAMQPKAPPQPGAAKRRAAQPKAGRAQRSSRNRQPR